jgi:hypothetical protein
MAPAESVSLAAGLALAFQQLRANSRDATAYNLRIISKEKGLVLLFLLSGASFAAITRSEAGEVKRERRIVAKTAKAAPPTAQASKAVAKSTKRSGFWRELRYLINIALPNGIVSRGGALLTSQLGLLVVRTLLTVRATQVNTLLLTRAIAGGDWIYWSRWFYNFISWAASATVVNSGLRCDATGPYPLSVGVTGTAARHDGHSRVGVTGTAARTTPPDGVLSRPAFSAPQLHRVAHCHRVAKRAYARRPRSLPARQQLLSGGRT